MDRVCFEPCACKGWLETDIAFDSLIATTAEHLRGDMRHRLKGSLCQRLMLRGSADMRIKCRMEAQMLQDANVIDPWTRTINLLSLPADSSHTVYSVQINSSDLSRRNDQLPI